MSNEYAPTPENLPAHPYEDDTLLECRVAAAYDVEAKLEDITNERMSYDGADALRYDMISLMREQYVEKIADVIFEISDANDRSVALDLDDLLHLASDVITPTPENLAAVDMSTDELKEESIGLAINRDLLPLLAPTDVTDETHRAIYYYPWPKDTIIIAVKRGYSSLGQNDSLDNDTSISFTRPTRLANIVVRFHYFPGEGEPQRLLMVKDEATQPSLPQ